MAPYRALILLLATIVISVRSLPIDIENSADISALSSSESDELEQQKSSEQNASIQEEDSIVLNSNSNSAAIDESLEEPLEIRVVKRSPVIPDPDRYQNNDKNDRPEAPSAHPTHDEYLEWKLRQPRFRRNLEDDSLNDDYHEVQGFGENSLEDYAQGCEVMEETSDENNETTYNDYRRKRQADEESTVGESIDAKEGPQSELSTEDSQDTQSDALTEDTSANDSEESIQEPATSNENEDSSGPSISEESEEH